MKTIVVKVNNDCNQKCIYCGIGDISEINRMDEKTLKNTIFKTVNWNPEDRLVSMQWYGGEPLLMGIKFWKEVVKLQKSVTSQTFHNSIQTNGTLLTNEYLDFFESNHFNISFSLDGCKEAHDLNRPYNNGNPSFEDTMYWIKETRKRKIGGESVILVLNKNTANYIEEVYKFSKENKINIKFNPQNRRGRAIDRNLELSSDDLYDVYTKLFDMWYTDDFSNRAEIGFLDCTIENIASIVNQSMDNNLRSDCSFFNTECRNSIFNDSILALAPNGDIFPCGKFIGENEFLYGNINQIEYISKQDTFPNKDIFVQRHKGLIECKSCRYRDMCNSGCANAAYNFHGKIMTKNPYCKAFNDFFKYVEQKLLDDGKGKDFYVLPAKKANYKILFSPLRNEIAYITTEEGEIIRDFIETGKKIPKKFSALEKYMKKLDELIIISPKQKKIHTQSDVTFHLSQKMNNGETEIILSKELIKPVVENILFRYSRNSRIQKTFTFVGDCATEEQWNILFWAINYINKVGVHNKKKIFLNTNASSFNKERIIKIRNNSVYLNFNIDVLPNDENLKKPFLNTYKLFQVVDQNIKMLQFYQVDFSICFNITNKEIAKMPDIINFIRVNYPNIRSIDLEPVIINTDGKTLKYKDYIKYFSVAHNIGKVYNILVRNLLTKSSDRIQRKFCKGIFTITPSGIIVACQKMIDVNDELFNNFLMGIVDNKVYKHEDKCQKTEEMYNQTFPRCSNCFAKWYCGGMCPKIK